MRPPLRARDVGLVERDRVHRLRLSRPRESDRAGAEIQGPGVQIVLFDRLRLGIVFHHSQRRAAVESNWPSPKARCLCDPFASTTRPARRPQSPFGGRSREHTVERRTDGVTIVLASDLVIPAGETLVVQL